MVSKNYFNKYFKLDIFPNKPRKISKLTLLLEKNQNEIKEYEDLVKSELNNSQEMSDEFDNFNNNYYKDDENYYNKEENIFEKINFIIYFYFNINNQEFIFPTESPIYNDNQLVYELIADIINKFNSEKKVIILKNKKYIINLKETDNDNTDNNFCQNNYILKPAKKSFKPKMDMPNYCVDTILKNLKNERICLLSINQQNILLHEIMSDKRMKVYNKKKFNDEESDRIQENKKKLKPIKINKKRYNSKNDYDTSRSHCNIF